MDLPGISPAVFYMRNRTVILVASVPLIAFSAYQLLGNFRSGEPWLNWLAAIILWLFLLATALRRRLVLNRDGVEYRDISTVVRIPWRNVLTVTSRRTLGIWASEGITIRTGPPPASELFIDLNQFSRNWKTEPLGLILQQNAPHLLPQLQPPDRPRG